MRRLISGTADLLSAFNPRIHCCEFRRLKVTSHTCETVTTHQLKLICCYLLHTLSLGWWLWNINQFLRLGCLRGTHVGHYCDRRRFFKINKVIFPEKPVDWRASRMKTWGGGEASCPASAQSNSLELWKRSDIGVYHRYCKPATELRSSRA